MKKIFVLYTDGLPPVLNGIRRRSYNRFISDKLEMESFAIKFSFKIKQINK